MILPIVCKPQGTLPTRAHETDAGIDLHSAETLVIESWERATVGTGLQVAVPPGYHLAICSRSGLAAKYGVFVLNAPGIIDPEYRGEIKVVLFNTRDSEFSIQKGDRIAQAILMRHEPIEWRKLMNLPETDRGIGGLGSSGR